MVNYAQLRDLDTSRLSSAAAAAGSLSSAMSGRGQEVASAADIPAGMWQGEDATAAADALNPMADPLYTVSDSSMQAGRTLEDLVGKLKQAQTRLQDAHDLAAGTGIVINEDGTVVTPIVDTPEEAEANEERARQIEAVIREAVQEANNADQSASSTLQNAAGALAAASTGVGRAGSLAAFMANVVHGRPPFGFANSILRSSPARASELAKLSLALTKKDNLTHKLGHSAARSQWLQAGKVAGKVAKPLTLVTSAVDQLARDSGRSDLSGGERAGRAVTRGGLQGGGAIAGAWAGLKGGALVGGVGVGVATGGVGAVPGAVVGGIAGAIGGGIAGAWGGGKAADWANGD